MFDIKDNNKLEGMLDPSFLIVISLKFDYFYKTNEQTNTKMARDLIHYQVRRALEKDGWVITNDPFYIRISVTTSLEIDLRAEKYMTAQKGEEQIFIEIKTFIKNSIVHPFYEALGQYLCYRDALRENKIDSVVFLAIPELAYRKMEFIPFILRRIEQYDVNLIIVDTINEKIERWIK